MLNLYQRSGESVHPWPIANRSLWTPPESVKNGQYEVVIFDGEECTGFITVKDCPPVFLSLRRSASGLSDEIAIGIPDDLPGTAAEQLAAVQIENAIAAIECIPQHKQKRIISAYGIGKTGKRALRPHNGPTGKILVSVFYEDYQDDFILSRKCPSMAIVTKSENVALSLAPELYAADLLLSAAETLKGTSKRAQNALCVDFGIDPIKFFEKK